MSSPNPDNYARGCDCNPNTPTVIPDDLWRNIPAPIVSIQSINDSNSMIEISYAPSNTRMSWLTENTEVWLFAHKRQKGSQGANLGRRKGNFRHPIDSSKPITNSNFWGGGNGAAMNKDYTYRTEFPFLVGSTIPQPYQRVALTDFDPYQFYKLKKTGINRQFLRADLPYAGTNNDRANYPNFMSRYFKCNFPGLFAYGESKHRAITTVKFQFRFVIPNPDSSSTKYTKIIGPASEIIKCSPKFQFTRPYGETTPRTQPRIIGLRLYV